MQNKGYVAGLAVVIVALLCGAVYLVRGESPAIAVVPLGLAVALGVVAWRVSRAEAFSPKAKERWQSTSDKPGVQSWLKRHADEDAKAEKK